MTDGEEERPITLSTDDVVCGTPGCAADSHSVSEEADGIFVSLRVGSDGRATVLVHRDGRVIATVGGLLAEAGVHVHAIH